MQQKAAHKSLSALLFLYREVLGVQLPWLDDVQRPTRPKRMSSAGGATSLLDSLSLVA